MGGAEGSSADLLVALTQGWREADNVIKLALDQRSTGHGEEDYAPLPPATARAIASTFLVAFGSNFLPSEIGPDPLVGRSRREMEKKLPTVFPLEQLRRLVETQSKPPPVFGCFRQ